MHDDVKVLAKCRKVWYVFVENSDAIFVAGQSAPVAIQGFVVNMRQLCSKYDIFLCINM